MRIVLWPTMYPPHIGGLEKMVHSLAKALVHRKHEVLVVSTSSEEKVFSLEGIQVHTFPFLKALFQNDLLQIKKILSEVSDILNYFRPDLLNVHGWLECFCFYQIRILKHHDIPLCLTLHGLLEQPTYETANCSKLWKRAQAVNTVSQAITPDRYHPFLQTIYNGLSPPQTPLQPLPKNRLLLVGRLSKEKGFPIAFHALKILLNKYRDLQLTVLGDGPEREKLVALKDQLHLPVEMIGSVPFEAVESYIDQSTLVLIPSSYESFSLTAAEAALRGRPVVASRILGLQETVEDQKTGILVEPNDVQMCAQAVDSLLSSPDRMQEMGKAAFERACRLFHIDQTTNRYIKMYEQATRFHHHSCL